MDERERVIQICRVLMLPPTQYVVVASGAMIMNGITAEERGKEMGDLDIFCSTRLWFDILSGQHRTLQGRIPWRIFTTDPEDRKRRADPPYLFSMMYDLEVDIFFNWRMRHVGDLDVNFLILNGEMIDGVPCIPLQHVLDWKREVGRSKDVYDIQLLEERLTA